MPLTYIVSFEVCSTILEMKQSKLGRVKEHIQALILLKVDSVQALPFLHILLLYHRCFLKITQNIKTKTQASIPMFAITQIPVTDSFIYLFIYWHHIHKTSSLSNLAWQTSLLSSLLFISQLLPKSASSTGHTDSGPASVCHTSLTCGLRDLHQII